jgi:hypothetical protein
MSVPFRCQCTRCKLTRVERGVRVVRALAASPVQRQVAAVLLVPCDGYFDQKPLAFEVDSVRPRNCE